MIGKNTKNKGSASLHSVLGILESRRKQKEPIYEQQIAIDHAEKFKMTDQQYEKVKKKLEDVGTLKDDTIMKLIDIRPKSEALLKQVLTMEKRTFGTDELQKILAITKEAAQV